jgi:hypothetical protein
MILDTWLNYIGKDKKNNEFIENMGSMGGVT